MKLVSFIPKNDRDDREASSHYGWMEDEWIVDAVNAEAWCVEQGKLGSQRLPTTLLALMESDRHFNHYLNKVRDVMTEGQELTVQRYQENSLINRLFYALEDVRILAPIPVPRSVRDFYAFEQHVKTARARRGLEMVPEWYDFPVFYFSNHQAVLGHEDELKRPGSTKALDFELEIACVISKSGKDITVNEAHDYIAGFTIMNDWSARDIQREEVKVGLGPAKGKDFGTSFGPWLVTLDDLTDVWHDDRLTLTMVARVNGEEYSRGNVNDLYWSFAEMIARASADCWLYAGDVIGSGTVGTGCILELGTDRFPWLKAGDVVELEIERLGVLRNTIVD